MDKRVCLWPEQHRAGCQCGLRPLVSKPAITGVGPETPTAVNAHGGRQSDVPYRADLLQPHALLRIAAIMKYGADKYGANNWHSIPSAEHLNHALVHLLAHLSGDAQDDHLGHAAWRVLSALDQVLSGREGELLKPKQQ